MFSLLNNIQEMNSNNKASENEILGANGKDEWGELDDFDSIFPENTAKLDKDYIDHFSPNFSTLDDMYLDIKTSTMSLNETKEENPTVVVPLASLEILEQNYGKGIKRLIGATLERDPQQRLSTNDILRLAGEKFIQSSSRKVVLSHQFGKKIPFFGLTYSETKNIDIVQKLLSGAEKFGQKKYDRARKLLDQCDRSSCDKGNPIERIVYYFSRALRERIDRDTGRVSSRDSLKKQSMKNDENIMKASPVVLKFHQELPLSQISIYVGMQAIVDRVSGAKKVHVIDLEIRSGIHTSILMQALANREESPIELLKITAVTTKSKWIIEDTGNRLRAFANSINLPFEFHIIMVPDIRDLKKSLFDFEPGETIAVNALYALRNMLGKQNELEFLMGFIKRINPRVMVVTEVEGKHNSSFFMNRFIEALFYFGAYFDCLEDCMGRDSSLRIQTESTYLGYGIRNIIVAEGDERTFRHVTLEIWRAFFYRFNMEEEELSSVSLIQASLVAKRYACWNSCTMYKDVKSLIVGWKGMPLQHVSAWNFENKDASSDDD